MTTARKWDETTFNDLSTDGSHNAEIVRRGIADAAEAMLMADADKRRKVTGARKALLAGLTDRDTFNEKANAIISGTDSRYGDMGALAEFQQKSSDILQDREEGDLDIQKKRFDNAVAPAKHAAEMLYKDSLTRQSRSNSKPTKQDWEFIHERVDAAGNLHADQVMADLPNYSGNQDSVLDAMKQYQAHSPVEIQKTRKAELLHEIARGKAQKKSSGTQVHIPFPEDTGAHWVSTDTDNQAARDWGDAVTRLSKIGWSKAKILNFLDQGKDNGWFENTWGKNDDMEAAIQAAELQYAGRD